MTWPLPPRHTRSDGSTYRTFTSTSMTSSPYSPSTAAYPTNVHDEAKAIQRQARKLADLGRAAAILGNDNLANQLFEIAETLEQAEESIRAHVANDIQQGYRAAVAGVGSVLSAMARKTEN